MLTEVYNQTRNRITHPGLTLLGVPGAAKMAVVTINQPPTIPC